MSEPDDYVSPPMDRVGTLACIDTAELARLRQNSERWEWCVNNGFPNYYHPTKKWEAETCEGDTPTEAVDAAIAAEKGTE